MWLRISYRQSEENSVAYSPARSCVPSRWLLKFDQSSSNPMHLTNDGKQTLVPDYPLPPSGLLESIRQIPLGQNITRGKLSSLPPGLHNPLDFSSDNENAFRNDQRSDKRVW